MSHAAKRGLRRHLSEERPANAKRIRLGKGQGTWNRPLAHKLPTHSVQGICGALKCFQDDSGVTWAVGDRDFLNFLNFTFQPSNPDSFFWLHSG
jgi:hypothetical protein